MKYVENIKQAANHLRLAVPMMVKHAVPPTPHNYAIWYHYVAGLDPELKKVLDKKLQQSESLAATDSAHLYSTYIAPESELEQQQQDTLYRLIQQIGKSVDATNTETEQLGSALTVAASGLNAAEIDAEERKLLNQLVADLNQNIEGFARSTAQFQSQLDAARDEIDQLRQALEQSKWAANHDNLTGLHNRSAFQQQISYLHSQHKSQSAYLILVDIDHFKQINDSFGHNAGDKVLQAVGKLLGRVAKPDIFTARYGGEEFAILIDKVSQQQAQQFADKLRLSLAEKKFNHSATSISVTASFGLAPLTLDSSISDCIEKADNALYQAKQSGRNRVATYDSAAFSG